MSKPGICVNCGYPKDPDRGSKWCGRCLGLWYKLGRPAEGPPPRAEPPPPPRAVVHKAPWLARFEEFQRFSRQGLRHQEIAQIMKQNRRTIERYAREARRMSSKYNIPGQGSNPDEPSAYATTEAEQCELAYHVAAWARSPGEAADLAGMLDIPQEAFSAAAAALALRKHNREVHHEAGRGLGAGRRGGAGPVLPGDADGAAPVRSGAGHAPGNGHLQRGCAAREAEAG